MSFLSQPAANLHSPTAIGDVAPNTVGATALALGSGSNVANLTGLAPNVAALVNGLLAQAFRVYDTTDGGSNFGYFTIQDRPGNLDYYLGVVKGGTGEVRGVTISESAGNAVISINYDGSFISLTQGGVARIKVNSHGVNLTVPTSPSGLSSGDVYSNAGILTIVP